MTHDQVAKLVRLKKEKHPEKYCSNSKCLYRTDNVFCPKHMKAYSPPVELTDKNA